MGFEHKEDVGLCRDDNFSETWNDKSNLTHSITEKNDCLKIDKYTIAICTSCAVCNREYKEAHYSGIVITYFCQFSEYYLL